MLMCTRSLAAFAASTLIVSISYISAVAQDASNAAKKPSGSESAQKANDDAADWKPMLPKDGLDGWEISNFGGEGEVENKDGELLLGRGDPLTGVKRLGKDFPTENFEMRWSAKRVDGSDFFAGVTFPVGKEYASFICGGWGGGLIGISSIDGNDASENQTASHRNFSNNKWYQFRLRVDANITVWLDDEQIISLEREGKKFSVRAEVMRSRPVGYCVFQSIVSVKDWEYRTLK